METDGGGSVSDRIGALDHFIFLGCGSGGQSYGDDELRSLAGHLGCYEKHGFPSPRGVGGKGPRHNSVVEGKEPRMGFGKRSRKSYMKSKNQTVIM